jgi:Na+-transporting NADH:ubiquinone oxidoreductase subunit NqrB
MTQILLGSLLLSAIHALIPNHWLPLVAIGRAEGWQRGETLFVTGITGLAHVTSTILIGILAGLLGYELSTRYASVASVVAPAILIGLGVIYLLLDVFLRRRQHGHFQTRERGGRVSRLSLVGSLSLGMFFSPCIEIEAYYFTAGTLGWQGIIAVSLVYLVVTVAGMVVLVDLGLKGAARIQSHFLEHHEKAVTGFLLIGLGVLAYFVEV